MVLYGCSITKRVSFRGANQEFTNVYHYDFSNIIGAADGNDLINDLKGVETSLHSTDVTFVLGRVWSAGQSPGQNQMLTEVTLSGTGNQSTNISMSREMAFLVQWPAGINIRGRPVYLRKWYHSCGALNGINPSGGTMQNTTQFTGPNLAAIEAGVSGVRNVTAGANAGQLASASGRLTTGAAQAYPWLEHHQLGDMWRG